MNIYKQHERELNYRTWQRYLSIFIGSITKNTVIWSELDKDISNLKSTSSINQRNSARRTWKFIIGAWTTPQPKEHQCSLSNATIYTIATISNWSYQCAACETAFWICSPVKLLGSSQVICYSILQVLCYTIIQVQPKKVPGSLSFLPCRHSIEHNQCAGGHGGRRARPVLHPSRWRGERLHGGCRCRVWLQGGGRQTRRCRRSLLRNRSLRRRRREKVARWLSLPATGGGGRVGDGVDPHLPVRGAGDGRRRRGPTCKTTLQVYTKTLKAPIIWQK